MKNSYILLRNNKESGPHTFAALENLGLKPNDLIWVEGQSVCWLYPGEISELKSLSAAGPKPQPIVAAPVTEEEPGLVMETVSSDPVIPEKITTPTPAPASSKGVPSDKKSVFISMPASAAKEEYVQSAPATVKQSVQPLHFTAEEEQPETTTKYSQPLEEIKEMYVKKLQDRKKKAVNRKNLLRTLRTAAVIAGLLGTGLLAGILLQKGNSKKAVQNTGASKQAVQQPESTSSLQTVPVDAGNSENLLPENNANLPSETITDIPVETKPEPPAVNPRTKKTIAPVTNENTGTNNPGPDILTASNGERNSKTRHDAPETQTVSIESISPLVSVKSNEYKIAAFGGIKDLQLTVTNDSKYILDNVQVEIQYLKPSDETVKTETLYFKTVPPNGTQTIAVPKSSRGVKVNYRITRIESKQINGVAVLQP